MMIDGGPGGPTIDEIFISQDIWLKFCIKAQFGKNHISGW
jgi:hypothetical protein